MPKPNYGYDKRQRELAKKRKKEDKAMKKTSSSAPEGENAQGGDIPAPDADAPPSEITPKPEQGLG